MELVSHSDELKDVEAKMEEYLENGILLGLLLNPETKQVKIYRHNQPVEVLQNPLSIPGEPVLPNFVLDLSEIFKDE